MKESYHAYAIERTRPDGGKCLERFGDGATKLFFDRNEVDRVVWSFRGPECRTVKVLVTVEVIEEAP